MWSPPYNSVNPAGAARMPLEYIQDIQLSEASAAANDNPLLAVRLITRLLCHQDCTESNKAQICSDFLCHTTEHDLPSVRQDYGSQHCSWPSESLQGTGAGH